MPPPRNYVYTDLSVRNSLTLEIEGVTEFDVVQFSASWAANEVPTAAVMLGVGRDVRTGAAAPIHATGKFLTQMQKAFVWFEPRGEYAPGVAWPAGRRKIFEGYFTGFAYRKISGKVNVVGNLIHWLAALGFSSAVTKNGHVSNPTSLNAAAVLQSLAAAGSGVGHYISELVPTEVCADTVSADLWGAVKAVFCAFTDVDAMPCGPQQECGGDGNFAVNDVAKYALNKIEGPGGTCAVPYRYGVPLKMDTLGIPTVEDAIASAIGGEMIESYAGTTFWDKLVGRVCPMFGMAVVPMADSALVAADVPAYRGGFWREIVTDDYDSFDMSRELHRPLRAVGVVAGYDSQTKVGVQETGGEQAGSSPADNLVAIGGCYAEDAVSPGDGMIMYVPAPPWLQVLQTQPNYVGGTTGLTREAASKTSTSPGAAGGPGDRATPDSFGFATNALYERYAHEVFVNQMLRGQTGSFSGRLRFDIAPLSILKLNASTEKFIGGGQDDLAVTVYGCVQRVTVSINAEAGMAGTTFQLSHVRTDAENQLNRTSVTEHPLFGASIHGGGKHGSPLVADYEFKPLDDANLLDAAGPTNVG